MKNKWVAYQSDYSKISEITEELNIAEITSAVLLNRGIRTKNEANSFFNPSINEFHDPYDMMDMDIAVERVLLAIESKERVLIYGDYDVDGITSTTIMMQFFQKFGVDVDYYIPSREKEGYGLSKAAAETIIKRQYDLVITVDCGITAIEVVDLFNENYVDVIITDHHACGEMIPNAVAVINPNRKDCKYSFKNLAGVGVAYKLIAAVCAEMEEVEFANSLLDIVAIGTVADVVSLTGENRAIVSCGLDRMKKNRRLGITTLLEACALSMDTITSTNIAYILAPRLNAAGRMETATIGVDLLLAEEPQKAESIVQHLIELNNKRKAIEESILNEVNERLKSQGEEDCAIIMYSEDWHHGVLGIVASKIAELYNMPTILMHQDRDLLKGSARSAAGVNIYETLQACSDFIEQFGGHEKVAGLSVKKSNIVLFSQRFNDMIKSKNIVNEKPNLFIDYRMKYEDVNKEIFNELSMLEPYGSDNPKPLFIYRNLIIEKFRVIGKLGNHISLLLSDGGRTLSAVGFNMENRIKDLSNAKKVDIICFMELNSWNNTEKMQLIIQDIHIK